MEYLNSASTEDIFHWRDVLEEYASIYGSLHIASDTETTGSSVVDQDTGLFHRVLEWSLYFNYKGEQGQLLPILDQHGRQIKICEAINPWTETVVTQRQAKTVETISSDVIEVHGITQEYLFGNEPGVHRLILKRPAPSYNMVFDAVEMMMSFRSYISAAVPVYIYFYNASFDISFLNSEMEMFSKPPIESFFIPVDPMPWVKTLLNRNGIKKYNLDVAHEWAVNNHPVVTRGVTLDRTIHSASIDTIMLERVISAYFLDASKK